MQKKGCDVTSGEKDGIVMPLTIFPAAVRNFEDRSYARIFGLILNHRNVEKRLRRYRHLQKKNRSRLSVRFQEVMRLYAGKIRERL